MGTLLTYTLIVSIVRCFADVFFEIHSYLDSMFYFVLYNYASPIDDGYYS